MKTFKVLIVIGIVLVLLIISGIILSQIKKETYVATMEIVGTNSYPPRLTSLRDRGIVEESTLVSIVPQLNINKLSIQPPKTTMSGNITLMCESHKETKNWELTSNVYGEMLEQRIMFKGIPKDADCIINVITTKCETDQARCSGGTLYSRFQT